MAEEEKKSIEAWGKELIRQGEQSKWDVLESKAEKSINQHPNNEIGHFWLGRAKNGLGRHKDAIVDFDKAIQINNGIWWAYYHRGVAKTNIGQYVDACTDYRRALKLYGDSGKAAHPAIYFDLGNAYFGLGRHNEAIAHFDKAIRINSGNNGGSIGGHTHYRGTDALNNRGKTYASLGRHNEAINDFDKALEISERDIYTYNNRGKIYAKIGRYDEAIDDYSKAIEIAPNKSEAYINRGDVKVSQEKYDDAIADYSKAIEISPSNSKAYNNRGNTYAKIGRYDEAIDDVSKAIKVDSTNDNYIAGLGILMGQKEAKKVSEKLITNFEKNVGDITNTNYIIELYQKEIEFSYRRLYGSDTSNQMIQSNFIGNSNGIDENKLSNRKSSEDKNSQKKLLSGSLYNEAVQSSKYLTLWVIMTVIAVSLVFYCAYLRVSSTELIDLKIHHIFHYTSIIAIISAPLFLNNRFRIKRAEQERTLLHALKRDMIVLLFWNAQELEDKTTNRSKLATTIAHHLGTNSTADICLRMMAPMHSQIIRDNNQGEQLAGMETSLNAMNKSNRPQAFTA